MNLLLALQKPLAGCLYLPALIVLLACGSLSAQNTLPGPAASPTAASGAAPRYRKLAPGVEKTIPADGSATDQITVYVDDRPPMRLSGESDLNQLLKRDPTLTGNTPEGGEPGRDVRIVHETWALEFTFKPMRFIRVDVPNNQGLLTSKLIWYLVYHVRNPETITVGDKAIAARPVQFVPVFWLQSGENGQLYPDRLIPVATAAIERREDPNRRLLNTAQIEGEIAPGQEVWGVVTWDNVDPAIDRFSILAQGLSGAYQWQKAAEGAAPAGAKREIKLRTLQLNFWRPGDAFYEHEAEIRYGAPGDVDYRWIYR